MYEALPESVFVPWDTDCAAVSDRAFVTVDDKVADTLGDHVFDALTDCVSE